ncbi:hypothetical protein DMI69_02655 [Escherichia coli]|nr:hypothetical protein [Escherichia coli]
MKASLALFSLLTVFTSYSLKSPAVPPTVVQIQLTPILPSQTAPDSKSAARYFTIRRMCSLPIPVVMSRKERGVCSDVVIRALRSQKVDLQKLVHEDMAKNFAAYPQNGS